MHILVLHQFYTTDAEAGIPRFNILAKRWRERGAEVTVLSGSVNYITGVRRKTKGLFSKEIDEKNDARIMRVFSTTFGLGYRTFLGRMASYISFFIFALFSSFFLPRLDLVIASSPPISIGFLGWCVSFFRRAPFVFEVRDLWPDEIVELGYIKNSALIGATHVLEHFLYARARRIVVNSPGLKEYLITKKSVDAEKIGVVVNPVEKGVAEREESSLIAWGKKNVIYTGAHSLVYDFDILLDAAKNLPEITFILVGDGRQKPELLKRVEHENIVNVHFYPSVPRAEVPRIVARADAGVIPLGHMKLLSYIYASKTFDYMAAGKPIVFMGEGINAALIRDEARCGVCISPGDREGLEKALISVLSGSEDSKAMGERGKRYLEEHFSAEKLGDEYLAFLEKTVHLG